MGFPAGSVVKNPPWVKKIPCRRKWQLTPAFLPGKSHEQKSLKGYSPWDGKRVGYGLTTKQQQQQYKGVYRGFKPEISLYSKQHRVDTDIDIDRHLNFPFKNLKIERGGAKMAEE